jgi:hypothetical protein
LKRVSQKKWNFQFAVLSVANRKTSEANKRVRPQSLGPIEKYNFAWGSNQHSVDLRIPEVERTVWNPNCGEASCAWEEHGGVAASPNIRTIEDGASRNFGTRQPKNMVTVL